MHNQKIKQRTDIKTEAKKIKSDSFTESNREMLNIGKIYNRIAPELFGF